MFTCIFFSCFCFLHAGSIFVSLFVPLNQPCPVDLIFYRTFEWHGGMWRKCQNLQRWWILGIWVFVSLPWSPAPEIWILGTWVSAPEVRRGSWDDLSSRIHPRWLCLGKPPVLRLVTLLFSNTLTTLRRFPGRDCVREVCRIMITWWAKITNRERTPVWTWSQACALKAAVSPPAPHTHPNEGCNPSFFCNEPRLKIIKSPVQVQRVSEGLLFPIAQVHAFHLPTRGPEKTPKFHTKKAGGYLFIIF